MRRINPRFEFRVPSFESRKPGGATALSNTKPESRNPEHAPAWRVGQSVVHPKFGVGVIVNAEGRGADARVHVNFRDAGLKWLMLEYAKLAPA